MALNGKADFWFSWCKEFSQKVWSKHNNNHKYASECSAGEFAQKTLEGPDEHHPEKFCFVLKYVCEAQTGYCFHHCAARLFCFHLQASTGINCIFFCIWVHHIILSFHSPETFNKESMRKYFSLEEATENKRRVKKKKKKGQKSIWPSFWNITQIWTE